NTPFTVIANKSFTLNQSLQSDLETFGPSSNSASRSFLASELHSLYNQDLFQILSSSMARIYPDSGMDNIYYGGFIRFGIANDEAVRNPAFMAGAKIQALEGSGGAHYYLPDRREDALGTLNESSSTQVVSV